MLPPILNIRKNLFFRFIELLIYLVYYIDQIHKKFNEFKKQIFPYIKE
jgi:hypothetical protein